MIDALNAQDAAELTAKGAEENTQKVQAGVGPIISAYKRFIHATFTRATQTLADFGLEPQGSGAVDNPAEGSQGGEGQGHASSAWDDEQEAEAHRQRQRDRGRSDPGDEHPGRAVRTAGTCCYVRSRHGRKLDEVARAS